MFSSDSAGYEVRISCFFHRSYNLLKIHVGG